MLLLDASNLSFDRIECSTLFHNLRSRNMCPVTLRLIMNMYISQKMQVRFSNVFSGQETELSREVYYHLFYLLSILIV